MTGDAQANISVNGRLIPVVPGDSFAAAMMRAGSLLVRRSRTGEPRGLWCGIGVCNDCVVIVNGRPNVRACITGAEPGSVVETSAVPR